MIGSGLGWAMLGGVQPTFIRALAIAGLFGLGTGVLALLAPKQECPDASRYWKWGVAGLLALDLLIANWGINPTITPDFYQSTAATGSYLREVIGDHRLFLAPEDESELKFGKFLTVETYQPEVEWNQFGALMLPDSNLLEGIASANNFDPLVPARFSSWIEEVSQLSPAAQSELLRLMDVAVVEKVDPGQPSGVRFEKIDGAARLRWVGCAEIAAGEQEAWESLIPGNGNRNGLKIRQSMVILEGVPVGSNIPCNGEGVAQIQVIGENSNRTEIQITTDRPGWLVQSDVWYPGWNARVDGKKTPVLRANVLFRAVEIPSGTHQVVIEYQPLSFIFGVIGTVVTLSGLIVVSLIKPRRTNQENGLN
jgi:hypothetical protein